MQYNYDHQAQQAQMIALVFARLDHIERRIDSIEERTERTRHQMNRLEDNLPNTVDERVSLKMGYLLSFCAAVFAALFALV